MPKKPMPGTQIHERDMVDKDRFKLELSKVDLEYRELGREINELREKKIILLKEGYENETSSPEIEKIEKRIEELRKKKLSVKDRKLALFRALEDVEKAILLNQYYIRQKERKQLDKEHTALCNEREELHKNYTEKRADLTKRIQANDNERHTIDEQDREYVREHGHKDHPELFPSPEKKREENAKKIRQFKQRIFDSEFRDAIFSTLRLYQDKKELPDKLRSTCEWWASQAADRDVDIPTFHGLGFDEIPGLTHFEAMRLSKEKSIGVEIAKFDEAFKREIGELFAKYRDPKLTEKVRAKIAEFKKSADEQGYVSWMPTYQGAHEPGILQLCRKVSEEK